MLYKIILLTNMEDKWMPEVKDYELGTLQGPWTCSAPPYLRITDRVRKKTKTKAFAHHTSTEHHKAHTLRQHETHRESNVLEWLCTE